VWSDEPEFTPLYLSILRVHGVLVHSKPLAVPPEGLLIGSDAGEEGFNLNASFFVAPKHVFLFSQGPAWFLRHLDKHLQCTVNGRKLAWDECVELLADDVIELGFVAILVHGEAGPALPEGTESRFESPVFERTDTAEPGWEISDTPNAQAAEPQDAASPSPAEELAAMLAGLETPGEALFSADPLLPDESYGPREQAAGIFRPMEFPGSFAPDAEESAPDDILAKLARESEEENLSGVPPFRAKPDGTGGVNRETQCDPLRLIDMMEGLSVEDVLEGPLTVDAILDRLDSGLPPPLLEPELTDPDPLALLGNEARTVSAPSDIVAREHHHIEIDTHYRNQGSAPPQAGNMKGHDDDE